MQQSIIKKYLIYCKLFASQIVYLWYNTLVVIGATMFRMSMVTLNLILIAICGIFAVMLQIFDITAMASMFVVAMCFFITLAVVPRSIGRVKKRNSTVHNLLIVLSTNITMMLLLFLMTTFGYLGLFNAKMFNFFEVVFYPSTLAILLLEYIIAYLHKKKYVNSISYTMPEEDE